MKILFSFLFFYNFVAAAQSPGGNPYLYPCTSNNQCKGDYQVCRMYPGNQPQCWFCMCLLGGHDCTENYDCCTNICLNGQCSNTGGLEGTVCSASGPYCADNYVCQQCGNNNYGYCNGTSLSSSTKIYPPISSSSPKMSTTRRLSTVPSTPPTTTSTSTTSSTASTSARILTSTKSSSSSTISTKTTTGLFYTSDSRTSSPSISSSTTSSFETTTVGSTSVSSTASPSISSSSTTSSSSFKTTPTTTINWSTRIVTSTPLISSKTTSSSTSSNTPVASSVATTLKTTGKFTSVSTAIITTQPGSSTTEPGFNCAGKPNGDYPNPNNPCSNVFFTCVYGISTKRSCQNGLYFNVIVDECMDKYQVPACLTTTVSTTVTTEKPFSCVGKPDGNYCDPNHPCSNTYYTCANGLTITQNCPYNLFFNQAEDECVVKDQVPACT